MIVLYANWRLYKYGDSMKASIFIYLVDWIGGYVQSE